MWPLDLPAAEHGADPSPIPCLADTLWPPRPQIFPPNPPANPPGQPKPPGPVSVRVMPGAAEGAGSPGAGSEEVKLPTPAGCSILGWALSILF